MALRNSQGQRKKYLTLELSSARDLVEDMCAIVSEFQSAKIGGYCWPTPFKVLRVLFLGAVSSAFLPSKKACWAPKLWHLGVDQQYLEVFPDTRTRCGTRHNS